MSGFFAPDADTLQQMLYADAVRGWDATGVFGVTKDGNIDIKKQAVAAGSFVTSQSFSSFRGDIVSKYHAVIGHNRKATHGEKNSEDAHPFWDVENKIVLVHNGMISNYKEFDKEATVDSDAIAQALAHTDALKVLSEITGAYALIWYDVEKKKIFFARNEARPLYIVETNELYAVVSEPGLAHWTLNRNNHKVIATTQIPDHTLHSYDVTTHKIEVVEKYEKKKVIPYTTTQHGGITNYGNVMYLPRQPSLVDRAFTRTKSALMTAFDAMEELNPNIFLSTKDIADIERAKTIYTVGQEIYVKISTYDEKVSKETGEISVWMTGQPINVEHPWIVVKTYLNKSEFDLLDLTQVQEFRINQVVHSKNILSLYGKFGSAVDSTETQNGTVVTDTMWFDNIFPDKCDLCRGNLYYASLEKSTIELEQKQIKHALCPVCTDKYEKDQNK